MSDAEWYADLSDIEIARIADDLGLRLIDDPRACPSCGSVAGYAEGPPCLTCHYILPPGSGDTP